MKVAILGSGGGGLAVAHDFSTHGHEVRLYDFENFPDNMTYLGFSFNWGNLTIDTWSNPELFLNGFNFLADDNDEDDEMNAGLSAIYSF